MFDQFKSAVDSRDLARQNRFQVNVPELSLEENLLCMDVNIPSPTIVTFDYKHQGPINKIPYDVVYETLSMTFRSFGDDGQPYGKFIEWIGRIFDESYRFNDKTTYVRDIIVREQDRKNSTSITHTFFDAFPLSVTGKTKSSDASNTPDQFTVNFEYRYSTQS